MPSFDSCVSKLGVIDIYAPIWGRVLEIKGLLIVYSPKGILVFYFTLSLLPFL